MALFVFVTLRGIDGHVGNGKTITPIDTDDLDGRVLDGNAGDGGVGE